MSWLVQSALSDYWAWGVSHPILAGAVFGFAVYFIGVRAADDWYDRKTKQLAYRAAVARERQLTAR